MSMTWFVRSFTVALMALHSSSSPLALHAENKPVIGSGNVAIADPTVPRPPTTPCEVSLFQDKIFGQTGGPPHRSHHPLPSAFELQRPLGQNCLRGRFLGRQRPSVRSHRAGVARRRQSLLRDHPGAEQRRRSQLARRARSHRLRKPARRRGDRPNHSRQLARRSAQRRH